MLRRPAGHRHERPDSFLFPRGVILNRDLSTIHELKLDDPEGIQEFVAHSWYDYSGGKESGLHPWSGETNLNYTGPQPPYDHLDVEQSYSWLKSPRWQGNAMEVGPLARVLMLYAKGHELTQALVNSTVDTRAAGRGAVLDAGPDGGTHAGNSDPRRRHAGLARLADRQHQGGRYAHLRRDPLGARELAESCEGVGVMEAPRGALSHWVVIEDGKIANYQAVVPSTWNAGPRDPDGQPGAYEAALEDGTSMHDPEQPLEILRTIHSFDPCIACAVHVTDPEGEELVQVAVR